MKVARRGAAGRARLTAGGWLVLGLQMRAPLEALHAQLVKRGQVPAGMCQACACLHYTGLPGPPQCLAGGGARARTACTAIEGGRHPLVCLAPGSSCKAQQCVHSAIAGGLSCDARFAEAARLGGDATGGVQQQQAIFSVRRASPRRFIGSCTTFQGGIPVAFFHGCHPAHRLPQHGDVEPCRQQLHA